jgi:NTP pyrophosphatase (non-canonical NTP hydrolase)
MKNIDPKILGMLIDKYGEDEQMRQAMGECGEFIAAAQNYYRAKKYLHRSETLEDMMEEAVDVYFMMIQARHINPELFDKIAEIKYAKIYKKATRCQS